MGAYLDRYLLFDVHINEMKRKVMVILIYVSRISDNLDNYSRIMVIQAIALSLINYCIRMLRMLLDVASMYATTSLALVITTLTLLNFLPSG